MTLDVEEATSKMELSQMLPPPPPPPPVQQTHDEVVKKEKMFIPLGGGKGMSICRYKQKLYVNIRNYNTDKDGRLKTPNADLTRSG